jgi:hypothetical protein
MIIRTAIGPSHFKVLVDDTMLMKPCDGFFFDIFAPSSEYVNLLSCGIEYPHQLNHGMVRFIQVTKFEVLLPLSWCMFKEVVPVVVQRQRTIQVANYDVSYLRCSQFVHAVLQSSEVQSAMVSPAA